MAKLGDRLPRIALGGCEQLAERLVGDLPAGDADVEDECDEPLLRTVVQVALEPAAHLVGRGDQARARRDHLFARLGTRNGQREQCGERREPALDVVGKRLVGPRRDDHRTPRPPRHHHGRRGCRHVARLAHARRDDTLAVGIDTRSRTGAVDDPERRVVPDRDHGPDREELLLRRAAPATDHGGTRRVSVAHDRGGARDRELPRLDRDGVEDERRVGLAGDERRDAPERRLLGGKHLDLGEAILELAVERLYLGRRTVALGQVETDGEQAGDVAVLIDDRPVRPGDLPPLAILREPVPDLRARDGDVGEALEEHPERRTLVGRDHDVAGVAADHLRRGEPRRALAGVVERENPARTVELADHAEAGPGEHVDVLLRRKRLGRLRRRVRGHRPNRTGERRGSHPGVASAAMPDHATDVTFLFTDIEGSTGLLQRLGTAYAAVLQRHRKLIGGAVRASGGRVVDCRGDEFFAVFDDGASAAAAAVAAQLALIDEPWPEGVSVRVRMGLHRGRAQVVGDGYVGMAVHHAARVSATARGGEILASAATVDGCGLETVDLGEHRLKGVPHPTQLVRIVAPGLEAEFPMLGEETSGAANVVRVALADDSVLLREGIARLLEEEGFEIVGQSGTAEDLLVLVDETLPDVAIVDIRMPPTKTDEGLRAAREIRSRHPHTGVLLLSQYVELEKAVELLDRDATGVGYLLKDRVADVEEFTRAIRRVADGGVSVDLEILEQLRD